jgi:hypothetical protein
MHTKSLYLRKLVQMKKNSMTDVLAFMISLDLQRALNEAKTILQISTTIKQIKGQNDWVLGHPSQGANLLPRHNNSCT